MEIIIALMLVIVAGFFVFVRFSLKFRRSGEIVGIDRGGTFLRAYGDGAVAGLVIHDNGRVTKPIPYGEWNKPGIGTAEKNELILLYNDHVLQSRQDRSVGPLRWLGLEIIGFPLLDRIHWYPFNWHKWWSTVEEEKGTRDPETPSLVLRSEDVSSLYLLFTYPLVVRRIEIADNLQIFIRGEVQVQAYDYQKAVIALKGNWLEPLLNRLYGVITQVCSSKSFDELRMEDKQKLLSAAILDPRLREELKASVGVFPIGFQFMDMDTDGPESAKILEALQAKAIAASRGAANLEAAKFAVETEKLDLQRRTIRAQGRAVELDTEAKGLQKIAEGGGAGMFTAEQLRGLQTLATGGVTPVIDISSGGKKKKKGKKRGDEDEEQN